MKESEIQKQILDYLKWQPECEAIRTYSVGIPRKGGRAKNHSRGLSDIIVCFKGRLIALEVKKPGGKVSECQKQFLERIRISGGIGEVVRGVNEVKLILERI